MGDYILPSRVMGTQANPLGTKQNNLDAVEGRRQVVQAFNKVMVLEKGKPIDAKQKLGSIYTKSTQGNHGVNLDRAGTQAKRANA